jgi:hypothetical protein
MTQDNELLLKSGDFEHGLPIEFVTDPKNQDLFEVDALPTADFAARALKKAQADYLAQWPESNPETVLWRLHWKTPLH